MCFSRRLIVSLKLYLVDCADWGFNSGIHVIIFYVVMLVCVHIFIFTKVKYLLNEFSLRSYHHYPFLFYAVQKDLDSSWDPSQNPRDRMRPISLDIDVTSINCFTQDTVQRDMWESCVMHWFRHVQETLDESWLPFLSMSFHLASNLIKSRSCCIKPLHQELPLFSIDNSFFLCCLFYYFTHFQPSRSHMME